MPQKINKSSETFHNTRHLFGSLTRIRLLSIFLNNPGHEFFVRELSRRIYTQLNAVRSELQNLENLGIIKSRADSQKKFYMIDETNFLFPELKALLFKAQMIFEKNLCAVIEEVGTIFLLLLTGKFVGARDLPVDMLIVGRVNRNALQKIINTIQQDIGEQINYTVMTAKEYQYRREITDKFLFGALENRNVILIDKLSNLKS